MEEQKNTPVRTSETIGKLSLALSKAQVEFDKAVKSSNNPFFKSKYADLSTIINCTKEYLCENELSLMQFVSGNVSEVFITTRLSHGSGEWLESTISGRPPKADAQGQGNVITYLRRYAQAAILNIAQEDDDGQSVRLKDEVKKVKAKIIQKQIVTDPGLISFDEAKILKQCFDMLASPNVKQKMFDAYGISKIEDLKKELYHDTLQAVNAHIEAKKDNR